MGNLELAEIVNRKARVYDLDPRIVACVILQESGGNTWATRFERQSMYPRVSARTWTSLSGPVLPVRPSLETERQQRATSYGLMQVLGETARWLCNYDDPFLTVLCDPERGVDAGCCVLSYYLSVSKGDYAEALARYNAGSPKSKFGQEYAAKVLQRVKDREYLKIIGNSHG